VYSATFPIGTFTSDLLQTKFKLSCIQAGELQGAVYLLAGVMLPLVGYFCDKYGRLPLLMMIAGLFNFTANLCWVFIPDTCVEDQSCTARVVWPVALMGLSYGIFAGTSWNALCYLVRQNQIGMTLGIASSLFNIFGAIFPPLMGKLQDETRSLDYGFYWVTRLSAFISLLGLLLCCTLYISEERKEQKNLSLSVKSRNGQRQ